MCTTPRAPCGWIGFHKEIFTPSGISWILSPFTIKFPKLPPQKYRGSGKSRNIGLVFLDALLVVVYGPQELSTSGSLLSPNALAAHSLATLTHHTSFIWTILFLTTLRQQDPSSLGHFLKIWGTWISWSSGDTNNIWCYYCFVSIIWVPMPHATLNFDLKNRKNPMYWLHVLWLTSPQLNHKKSKASQIVPVRLQPVPAGDLCALVLTRRRLAAQAQVLKRKCMSTLASTIRIRFYPERDARCKIQISIELYY